MSDMNEIRTLTDQPCDASEDLFDIEKYTNGLHDFLKHCQTPLTVAIQGGWGSGKTSLINNLQALFKGDADILPMYFNTWQYEQLREDDLYTSLLTSLMLRLEGYTDESTDGTPFYKKVAGNAGKIGMFVGKVALAAFTQGAVSVEAEEMQQLIERKVEETARISKLRDSFAKLVHDRLQAEGAKRFVIFIDDLDRLNPKLAVELLETIKLFLDVDQCVFVLAIDYDVVVQGVRTKYGSEMSIAKCRAFFDKIIQVPFRIPENSYSCRAFVEKYVAADETYGEKIVDFLDGAVGANPRMLKRTLNSYSLISSVRNAGQDVQQQTPLDQLTLFMMLALQNAYPELYEVLSQNLADVFDGTDEDEAEQFSELLRDSLSRSDLGQSDKQAVIETNTRILRSFLDFIGGQTSAEIRESVKKSLTDTSVTGVSSTVTATSAVRNKNEKVAKVAFSIAGQPVQTVLVEKGSAVNAIITSADILFNSLATDELTRAFQIITNTTKKLPIAICTPELREAPAKFLVGARQEYTFENTNIKKVLHRQSQTTLCFGTSTGFDTKCDQLAKMLNAINQVVGADATRALRWYREDGSQSFPK